MCIQNIKLKSITVLQDPKRQPILIPNFIPRLFSLKYSVLSSVRTKWTTLVLGEGDILTQ